MPAAVPFRTKPQWAAVLLGEVVASGHLPARWVTCDEAYGQNPAFLDAVADLGLGYCAEVPHSTRVWTEAPATHVPHAAGPRCAPGPEVWLLLCRHPRHHELTTYLCHAPADMPLTALAHLAGRRWPIESCFQEDKQNVGLGDYEGRS